MRPPRSGWTIAFFSILAAFIVAAGLGALKGTALILAAGAVVAACFLYRHLSQR